jgi:hypothetical protein
VPARPVLDLVADPNAVPEKLCVQDNNTGYIWSGTILEPSGNNGQPDSNVRIYSELNEPAERAERAVYECDIDDVGGGKSWQLPTVQDLMTIMDVEKLKTSRELGIMFTNSEGEDVQDTVLFYVEGRRIHSASYWTSSVCEKDASDVTSKLFTVNFLNGELACADKTSKHSIMMLYK